MAINERFTDGAGTKRESVIFVEIEAWGKLAENAAKYLSKGRSALVSGRLAMDQWLDQASGQRRTRYKIVAEIVQFLPSGMGAGAVGA